MPVSLLSEGSLACELHSRLSPFFWPEVVGPLVGPTWAPSLTISLLAVDAACKLCHLIGFPSSEKGDPFLVVNVSFSAQFSTGVHGLSWEVRTTSLTPRQLSLREVLWDPHCWIDSWDPPFVSALSSFVTLDSLCNLSVISSSKPWGLGIMYVKCFVLSGPPRSGSSSDCRRPWHFQGARVIFPPEVGLPPPPHLKCSQEWGLGPLRQGRRVTHRLEPGQVSLSLHPSLAICNCLRYKFVSG